MPGNIALGDMIDPNVFSKGNGANLQANSLLRRFAVQPVEIRPAPPFDGTGNDLGNLIGVICENGRLDGRIALPDRLDDAEPFS